MRASLLLSSKRRPATETAAVAAVRGDRGRVGGRSGGGRTPVAVQRRENWLERGAYLFEADRDKIPERRHGLDNGSIACCEGALGRLLLVRELMLEVSKAALELQRKLPVIVLGFVSLGRRQRGTTGGVLGERIVPHGWRPVVCISRSICISRSSDRGGRTIITRDCCLRGGFRMRRVLVAVNTSVG
jgi:hypothetical protein